MSRRRRSFDSQSYRQHIQTRLILGGFLILLVVGGGLIWAIYGRAAALTALLCLSAGLGVFGLLWLLLALLDRWVKDDQP